MISCETICTCPSKGGKGRERKRERENTSSNKNINVDCSLLKLYFMKLFRMKDKCKFR